MSVKIFSNYSSLKIFHQSCRKEVMPSLDFNSSSNMDVDPNSLVSEDSSRTIEEMPQFSIELGGGRQWWF